LKLSSFNFYGTFYASKVVSKYFDLGSINLGYWISYFISILLDATGVQLDFYITVSILSLTVYISGFHLGGVLKSLLDLMMTSLVSIGEVEIGDFLEIIVFDTLLFYLFKFDQDF